MNRTNVPIFMKVFIPSKNILSDDKAFTLLEVMITLAIIAIALTAVFSSQGSALTLAQKADVYTTASFLAQEKLAYVQTGLVDFTDAEGDFGEDYPDYRWKIEVEEPAFEEVEELELIRSLVLKVNLSITYNDNRFEHLVTTYVVSKGSM